MKCQAKGKNKKRGKIRKRENLSWVNEGGWVVGWVGSEKRGQVQVRVWAEVVHSGVKFY